MKKIKYILPALFFVMIFSSCKKKFDLPPAKTPLANSGSITIDSIRKKYINYYITSVPKPTKFFRFDTDVTLTCTVTADEVSGNIYKGVFVSDGTAALSVKLLNYGGLYKGDKIMINLNGVLLDNYGLMIQLDSVDIEKSVMKISSGNPVVPKKMTFNQMLTLNGYALMNHQSELVEIDSVEFADGDKGKTFADTSVYKYSLDKTLKSMNSNQTVVVRTSGYSNFAKTPIPCGRGKMVVIVGQFNSDPQLTIPNFSDVMLSNDNCPMLSKGFDGEPSVTHGGWTNYKVSGNVNWTIGNYGGKIYGNISNYTGVNNACETWFISPAFDISNASNPRLSFISAYKYTGPTLEVLVSTNYTSGNPNSATWTSLNPTLSSGNFVWAPSGNISLNSYKSANTRIAYKYTGTSSDGSTWEIDDIVVYPN